MKQQTKCLALAAVCALIAASSAQAQAVTGSPFLSNIDPSTLDVGPNALYANWAPGVSLYTPTFTSLATGLEANAAQYGSLYYVVPGNEVQSLNPSDTVATLTMTVNTPTPANVNWIGLPFILNDNGGAATYGGYSAPGNPGSDAGTTWNGNVVTETETLSPGQIAAIQAGGDAIYSFNLEVDPAGVAYPQIYDITFDSLTLSPVPEPTTMALGVLGAGGLLIFRRRK